MTAAEKNPFWYLQDMSPEMQDLLKDAIEIAKKVKKNKDYNKLPSNIKREINELDEASAHPKLSPAKVTVSRLIKAAKRVIKFALFMEMDHLNSLMFAIRKANEIQKVAKQFEKDGQPKIAKHLMKIGAKLLNAEGDFAKVLEIAKAWDGLSTEEKKFVKLLPSGNAEVALARTDLNPNQLKALMPFFEKIKDGKLGPASQSAAAIMKEVQELHKKG